MSDKKVIQKIVVAGVVIDNGKALILQRNSDEDIFPNMWELPSGKREPFESSVDAVKRELKEEAGMDIEVIMPISTFEYQIEKEGEIRDTTQINFLVKPKGSSEIKLSHEHQNFAWISESEIDKYSLKEVGDVIRKVLKIEKREIAS